jgi:hypothetical protein
VPISLQSEARRALSPGTDAMDDLPSGVLQKLAEIEDDDDDVDYQVPDTGPRTSSMAASTADQGSTSQTPRTGVVHAPALQWTAKIQDPYVTGNQLRQYKFAAVTQDQPKLEDWKPATSRGVSITGSKSKSGTGQVDEEAEFVDYSAPENQALAGVFGTSKVKRAYHDMDVDDLDAAAIVNDGKEFDPDLQMTVNANIRANFKSMSEFYNDTGAAKTYVFSIGGQTMVTETKAADERLALLDKDGQYKDGLDRGLIRRSRMKDFKKNVRDLQEEMRQAEADYQTLLSMSAVERTKLIQELRQPLAFTGAFPQNLEEWDEDQFNLEYNTAKVSKWLGNLFLDPHLSRSPTQATEDASGIFVPDDDDGNDGFTGGDSYIPLPRDELYERDAMNFSRRLRGQSSRLRGRELAEGTDLQRRERQARSAGRALRAPSLMSYDRTPTTQNDGRAGTWAAFESKSGSRSREVRHLVKSATSSSMGDILTDIDDTPEFQQPKDTDIPILGPQNINQLNDYDAAIDLVNSKPRTVMIRLHEPVEFSPARIAEKVLGGTIQELQLFPVQRIAIVVFVHPAEAQAFITHVTNCYTKGRPEEFRALQIDAVWYRDAATKQKLIVPAEEQIMKYLFAEYPEASRSLMLHHISSEKKIEEVNKDLGDALGMPLAHVRLLRPRQDFYKRNIGSKVVLEFLSIKDAIEAWARFDAGQVEGYYGTMPEFLLDRSRMNLFTERSFCRCLHCREQREAKEQAREEGKTLPTGEEVREMISRPYFEPAPAAPTARYAFAERSASYSQSIKSGSSYAGSSIAGSSIGGSSIAGSFIAGSSTGRPSIAGSFVAVSSIGGSSMTRSSLAGSSDAGSVRGSSRVMSPPALSRAELSTTASRTGSSRDEGIRSASGSVISSLARKRTKVSYVMGRSGMDSDTESEASTVRGGNARSVSGTESNWSDSRK